MTTSKAPAPAKPDDDLPPAFLGIDAAAIAAAEPAQKAAADAVKAEKAPPQEGKMPRHLAKAMKDREAMEALAKAPAKPIDPKVKAAADRAESKRPPIGMSKAQIAHKADRAEGKAPAKAKAPERPAVKAPAKLAPKGKAKAAKPAGEKRGPREEHKRMAELAAKGRVPDPPDFNKPTHKGYRNHLAGIVVAVKAKDIKTLKGLKEFWDKKDNSSSKIMLRRYLDNSLIALQAQAKAK